MNRLLPGIALVLATLVATACAAQEPDQQRLFETKSSQGEVSLELTPRVTDDGGLLIDLTANTHSGDLADLDLATLVSLSVGDQTYRPVAVTGLEGHHSEGSITFEAAPIPESFAIVIGPVRGMPEQRFVWP